MPHFRWSLLFPFLLIVHLDAPASYAEDAIAPTLARADANGATLWYDIRHLGLEGEGWTETKAPFDRLPARAEGVVRAAIWNLRRQSAGLCVRFMSDAPTIE